MKEKRVSVNVTVALILISDNNVLLMKRCNTGYEDGKYALPAGHIEEGESLKTAMVRETSEEIRN